jgi:DNA repair protein RadD
MRELYPHQIEAVNSVYRLLKAGKKPLVYVATGGGKGSVFSKVALDATSKGKRVLIVVNKLMLINNAIKELKHFGLNCTQYSGQEKEISPLMCGTFQSLQNMTERCFDVCIIDEAHNYDTNGKSKIRDFVESFKNVMWIGLTATPFRGKKYIFGEDRFWDLAYKKDLNDLTNEELLVPMIYQNQNKDSVIDCTGVRKNGDDYIIADLEKELLGHEDKIEAQVFDCLKKSKDRKKIIFITTGIDHAKLIFSLLGSEATIIHSELTPMENKKRMEEFQYGDKRYLVSVLIASEGFDCPIADCIVMMRPTRSPRLYIQAAGRVLRLFKGKENALFLDYGQVVNELGSIYDLKIHEDLQGKEPKKSLKLECPICDRVYFNPRRDCECGKHTFYRSCLYCSEQIPMTEVCLCGGGIEARTRNLTLESYSKDSAIKIQRPNFEFCMHQGPKQEVYLCKIREGMFGTHYYYYIPHFKMEVIAKDLDLGDYKFFSLQQMKEVFENVVKFVILKKDGKYFKPVAFGLENTTYFLK